MRAWLLGLVAVAGPPLLLFLYYRTQFAGLISVEALDFAQLGRNLSAGHGFSTYVIRPLALGHGSTPLQQPDLIHGPLFPFLLAVAFAAFGATDTVTAAVSGIFYLLTVPIVYALAKRIFGPNVAAVTTGIFTVNSLLLEYAISGMHITLCILLMTATFLVLYNIASKHAEDTTSRARDLPRGKLILAGILASLLYLTEPVLLWVVPVIGGAAVAFTSAHRTKSAVYFLIPIVVLAMPWMIRNAHLTGNPAFGLRGMELWMNTRNTYPGISAYRVLPEDLNPRPGLLTDVAKKVFVGVGIVLDTWPQIAANWALAFFLPSLLFRFSDRAATRLRRVTLWAFFAAMGGMLLFQIQMPLFVSFVPIMLAYAVAYLLFLVQQAQLTRQSAALLTLLLGTALIYPVAVKLVVADKPREPAGKQSARALAAVGLENTMVLTNQPWTVAWYADKPALLVPAEDRRISDVRKRFPTLRWLLLTEDVRGWSPEWQMTFDTLERWSFSWALAANQKPPKPLHPLVFQGPNPPLVAALSGFVSFPPLERVRPGLGATVLAYLPSHGAAPSGAGR